jgi:hypothetical protein
MNELEQAATAIAMLCGVSLNSPRFSMPKDVKISCIEQFTNCAVDLDGKIDPERVLNCEKNLKLPDRSKK